MASNRNQLHFCDVIAPCLTGISWFVAQLFDYF